MLSGRLTCCHANTRLPPSRPAPLAAGLGLPAQEVIGLGLDLIEDLLDEDPEVLRARVAEVRAERRVLALARRLRRQVNPTPSAP